MRGGRIIVSLCLLAQVAAAAAKHSILYVTATYGYRHDSIPASVQMMQELAAESDGVLEVVNTEDVSLINAEYLSGFDAIFFFTSGELPLSDQQKADLLDFVRHGKGFGGSHSATDTFYTWPEYGEMIGAYFDGHPWTQQALVNVEQPDNPIVSQMAPSFTMFEEYYQFRNFQRDQVLVLLRLDTSSVDLSAEGVNPDDDYARVWIRNYGRGRVFYSAFGHFDESWQQPLIREMLRNGLLWLTGEIEAEALYRAKAGERRKENAGFPLSTVQSFRSELQNQR